MRTLYPSGINFISIRTFEMVFLFGLKESVILAEMEEEFVLLLTLENSTDFTNDWCDHSSFNLLIEEENI